MKKPWISGFCGDGNCGACRGEFANARPGGQSAFCAHPHHTYEETPDGAVPQQAG